MRKIYLLMLTLLCAVGAWAQEQPTVVATMQQLVNRATINTATVSSDWETNVTGGAVYSFGNGTFIGGIQNQDVLNAVNGDQYLIIAAWVYGQARQCIFGYGDSNTGFKFQQTGAGLSSTTKNVADMDGFTDANYVKANQWNLVALAIPAKTNSATKGRYYVGDADGLWTKNVKLSNMNEPTEVNGVDGHKFAIGSGDQGTSRDPYNGLIANLTILTHSVLPTNAQIAEAVGAAPTYTLSGARAALQSKVDEIGGLIGDNPGYYSSTNASTPLSNAQAVLANSSSTVDEMVEKLNALNALSINMPEPGKKYLLISANPAFEAKQGVKKAMYAGEVTYEVTENGQKVTKTSRGTRWGTLNLTDDKFKWTFTSGYNVTNVGTGEKMTTWANGRQILSNLSETTPANITLVSLGQGQFNIKNGGNVMHTEGHSSGDGVDNVIVSWGGGVNTSSAWYIIDAENIATITYRFKNANSDVLGSSQTYVTYKDRDYPSFEDWVSVFYDVTGFPTVRIPASGNQVVELIATPKIETFANANIVDQWYALDIHGNEAKYPLYHNAGNLRVEYTAKTDADEYTRGAVKSKDYLWAFIGNPFTGVKLYNMQSQKYAIQASDGENVEITLGAEAEGTAFKVHSSVEPGLEGTAFALKVDGRNYYFNHRGTMVKGWTAADGGSSLRVWPANVGTANFSKTLSAEYGTLVLPFYSEIPSGLELYTCPSVGEDNVVVLTPVTDWVRPNTAYIVKGVAGQKYTFTNTTKDPSTADVTTGLLTGVLVNTTVPAERYVLAKKKDEEKVGFFKVASGAHVTCNANKCYLTAPASSSARAFFFDAEDVETGINAVAIEETVPANAAIYDLSGRRVQSAKSGLYIVNGKKVIK